MVIGFYEPTALIHLQHTNLKVFCMQTSSTTSGSIHVEKKTPTQRRLLTVLGFITIVLIWGSFPVAAKLGVEQAPPLLFSSLRFLLAFLIMLPIITMRRTRLWISPKQHLQVFLMSLFMVGLPSSIFFASAPYAPIGVLTLMWSTTPLFTALFNMGGVGEARGWRLIVSLLVGLLGIGIVLLGRLPFLSGSTGNLLGNGSSGLVLFCDLAVLASSGIYGFGLRLAKRNNTDMSVIVLTTWQMFYTGIFVGLLSLIFEHGYTLHPTWSGLAILLYLAVFCSCITFFLTFWLIRRIGAIRTAYSDFIIPGVTLILSFFFLSESITPAKIIGFVLVMLGCFLVQL